MASAGDYGEPQPVPTDWAGVGVDGGAFVTGVVAATVGPEAAAAAVAAAVTLALSNPETTENILDSAGDFISSALPGGPPSPTWWGMAGYLAGSALTNSPPFGGQNSDNLPANT